MLTSVVGDVTSFTDVEAVNGSPNDSVVAAVSDGGRTPSTSDVEAVNGRANAPVVATVSQMEEKPFRDS